MQTRRGRSHLLNYFTRVVRYPLSSPRRRLLTLWKQTLRLFFGITRSNRISSSTAYCPAGVSLFFFFIKSSPEWRNQCTYRPPLMPSNTSELVLQQTRTVRHVFLGGGFPSVFILRCNCLLSLLLVWESAPASCSDLFFRMSHPPVSYEIYTCPPFTANLHV